MLLRARQIPSAINPALAIGPVPWQIRVPWQASASPGLLSDFTDVGWRSIAIGHLDESGNSKPSSGRAVTTRLVYESTGYGGNFEKVEGQGNKVRTQADSYTWNFFCLRAPYFYLQSWIDWDSLPPRHVVFPLEPDMNFEGEFWEIVNAYSHRRRQGHGTVDFIDYEGIDCSLQQFQDDFSGAFFGPYDLGSALKSGLRGNDLIPALLSDFNVWQACPPDRWIKANPSSSSLTSARAPFQTAIAGHWDKLPSEIALEILSDLTLSELLSFTSVCRCFHHRFGDSDFLSLWLRSQLHRPLNSTHWFMPVATVNGEVDKFYAACNESKSPGASATISKSAENSVVFSAGFPLFEFFRTNFGTDSMKNRRRLWRISQQFRAEWYRYRTGEDLKKSSPSQSLENSDDEEEEEGSDGGDSDSSEGGGSS